MLLVTNKLYIYHNEDIELILVKLLKINTVASLCQIIAQVSSQDPTFYGKTQLRNELLIPFESSKKVDNILTEEVKHLFIRHIFGV